MSRVSDFESLTALFAKAPSDAQISPGRRFGSLRAVIDGLPPLCQRIFMLRKVHRLSHAEIAEVFGLSRRGIEKYVAEEPVRCQDRLRQLSATREQKSPSTTPGGRDGWMN
ncbi:MAG: sigma factor-like helix-turn-helix DNA-binding protein [Steroidobacteraceae bacterium]